MIPSFVKNKNKFNNFNIEKIGQRYLGQNPDINNMKTTGIYGLYNCTQAPVTGIGVLEVLAYTKDWILQRYTQISSNVFNTWERIFYEGKTWSEWKQK